MEFYKNKKFFVTCAVVSVLAVGVFFNKDLTKQTVSLVSSTNSENQQQSDTTISKTPAIVKAIYMTGWSAGNGPYYDYLSSLFSSTEINAVVIDIKDSSGYVFYNANVPEVQKYKLYNYSIKNIDSIIKFFHDKNIYVIGRISVFEDPMYSQNRKDLAVYNTETTTDIFNPILWTDRKGLSWMDPASKEVWDYNIALAKDAVSHGFDEINFDYIRFPSDGDFSTLGFPIWDKKTSRSETIKSFFAYVRNQLPNEILSVDLFGLTTVSRDDLGVGQVLEDALKYFDYICPMVYPSHYATGFRGFENPAEHPYEVAQYSIESAYYRRKIFLYREIIKSKEGNNADFELDNTLMGKIRPWLQDFNLGAVYTADMVKAEINAIEQFSKDDYVGFMLWNPRNYYTKEAIAN
jgi:hypothetical protein